MRLLLGEKLNGYFSNSEVALEVARNTIKQITRTFIFLEY
jgi:hypothetical protein